MKPAYERTPRRQWESFHCDVVRGASYNATWHFHPECQLTLVLRSSGYRLVGDNITALKPGDLVLVGPNLPHVWHADSRRTAPTRDIHAIVVRFLESFLGADFLAAPEMQPVRRLLKRARRGLRVRGGTRDRVADEMQRLATSEGLQRLATLLSILAILAESNELEPIASPDFTPTLTGNDQPRVERVIGYIHSHLEESPDRKALAAEACLSLSAFSRFFKLRTGKTLPEYVNELRVGRACRLLTREGVKVTDVALECGFHNLANFNRRFRLITGLAPREYGRRWQGNSGWEAA